jgi:hypothetical protein
MNRLVRVAPVHLIFGLFAFGCAEGTTLDGGAESDATEEDGTVEHDPVGAPCVKDEDCPDEGMTCLTAYVTYAEPDVGMIIPRAYCTYAERCESDEECGPGAGCWRPLDGASEGELAALEFDPAPLVDFGQCLVACEEDADCGEGFACQKPLLRALAPLESAPERRFCVFDDRPPCDDTLRAPAAGTCTLTYALGGYFQITETPLGFGDEESPIGPGTLVLEVSSVAGEPAEGSARVKCFEMDQRMSVQGIHTAVRASFANPSSATGTITGGELRFDLCDYDASRGLSSTSWTLAATATGPGCLVEYASRGAVFCATSAFCGAGGLVYGSNPQDDVWTQPFNAITFQDGWDAVAMGGAEQLVVDGALVDSCKSSPCPAEVAVEIPNDNPSRTWLSFTGTLAEQRCD